MLDMGDDGDTMGELRPVSAPEPTVVEDDVVDVDVEVDVVEDVVVEAGAAGTGLKAATDSAYCSYVPEVHVTGNALEPEGAMIAYSMK